MCLRNDNPELLKKLRSKGHVLIPVYKYKSARNYLYEYKKGWNTAFYYSDIKRKMTKKLPYALHERIFSSFHFYLYPFKQDRFGEYFKIQQTFWIYADEITGCEYNLTVTCSRALIKKLNHAFIQRAFL